MPEQVNQSWSMDFMSEVLENGHRFRTFNVIYGHNRETLAIEVDLSLPAARVIRVLDRLIEHRGYPKPLRCDNGPEFIWRAALRLSREIGFTIIGRHPL